MKRIDEKIKEIKKKDRINRILFFSIVGLIVVFLYYASTREKTIDEQAQQIEKQRDTLLIKNKALIAANTKLTRTRDSLLETREKLSMSMTEEEFWTETLNSYQKSNNVSPFFDYITFGAGIERKAENIKTALNKISAEGKKGFVFAGKQNNETEMSENRVVKVIYRSDNSSFAFNSKPKAGDIVQLTINSRRVYGSSNNAASSTRSIGYWQIGLPAYVKKVYDKPGDVVILELRYFEL